jgi:hypothetical protein
MRNAYKISSKGGNMTDQDIHERIRVRRFMYIRIFSCRHGFHALTQVADLCSKRFHLKYKNIISFTL